MNMAISRKKTKGLPRIAIESDSSTSDPAHDLKLYIIPPSIVVPLAEVYSSVIERLKVLKILERTLPTILTKNVEDEKSAVFQELRKQGLKTYVKLLVSCGHGQTGVEIKERTADYISHFILRLIYSQSGDWRHWFLKRELELFRLRFHSLNANGFTSFLEEYGLRFTPISDEEKSSMIHKLLPSTANMSYSDVETTTFFKVPYTDVLDLISVRKVYVCEGYAYIPNRDIVSVFCTLFKNKLRHGLEQLAVSSVNELKSDERLKALLTLPEWNLDNTHHSKATVVTENDLDALSQASFPPCMRQMHESIRQTHHAKHGARMQYGLFLKGIGLPLEGAIQFWKNEFTKKMSHERFQKEYLYSIRHNYGQEGRRVSYTPFSCAKIVSESIGIGDCHGCPFKDNSSHVLKRQFERCGIPPSGIQAILHVASQRQYQLACTKYFEVTHSSAPETLISHPNEFFDQSRKILSNSKAISEENCERNGNVGQVETDEALCTEASSASVSSDSDNSS